MQRALAVRARIGPALPEPQVGAGTLAQQEGEVFRGERRPRRHARVEPTARAAASASAASAALLIVAG
jgi:hypothetical protein